MFEIALPVLQIAWMGICTTGFEIVIDILYLIYDSIWMGVCGNICEACGSIPMIGEIAKTIWEMLG